MADFMKSYGGKTVVITGAASGMGLCAAKTLVKAGANVVMCDINAKGLKAAVDEVERAGGGGGKGHAFACVTDVRKFADAQKAARLAVRRTGRIDVLIPFAGGWEPRMLNSLKPFYEQPVEVIDWGVQVNLMGPVYFARACMPQMVKQGSGVICCIGSVDGFACDGLGPMYGTSKSGLFTFVKGLSLAGAEHGVRAICVAPGPVMTRPGMAAMKTLMGRASQPQEVVDFVLYLCSDAGACAVGSTYLFDCGRLTLKP